MVKDNAYNTFLKYSKNIAEYNFEEETLTGFGFKLQKEWAMFRLITIAMEYHSEHEDTRDRFYKSIQWLSMDIEIQTDIHLASILPLDMFILQLLFPSNPYAREIINVYNPNDIHNHNLMEAFAKSSSYEEVIRIFYIQTNMDIDDFIEYIRYTLFSEHFIHCPVDDALGYSLENGICITVMFLQRLINFKTFL